MVGFDGDFLFTWINLKLITMEELKKQCDRDLAFAIENGKQTKMVMDSIFGNNIKNWSKEKKDINQLINYAVKEGHIGDEAENWSDAQKKDYYNRCSAVDSNDYNE